jgi:DHA2 family multidrug resistance protein-like MFS transporter
MGAALVALSFARMPLQGTRFALLIGVGFALAAALVSSLRLFDRAGQTAQSRG